VSTLRERTLAKVRIPSDPDGCWIWEASTDRHGYGQIRADMNGRLLMAHRVVYELWNGPIPTGFQIDHLCRVPLCVRPQAENIRRGDAGKATGARNRAKTHCPQGHEYAGANLYIRPSNGGRHCMTCINAGTRARRAAAKANRKG
jgi:hypothetical protein